MLSTARPDMHTPLNSWPGGLTGGKMWTTQSKMCVTHSHCLITSIRHCYCSPRVLTAFHSFLFCRFPWKAIKERKENVFWVSFSFFGAIQRNRISQFLSLISTGTFTFSCFVPNPSVSWLHPCYANTMSRRKTQDSGGGPTTDLMHRSATFSAKTGAHPLPPCCPHP